MPEAERDRAAGVASVQALLDATLAALSPFAGTIDPAAREAHSLGRTPGAAGLVAGQPATESPGDQTSTRVEANDAGGAGTAQATADAATSAVAGLRRVAGWLQATAGGSQPTLAGPLAPATERSDVPAVPLSPGPEARSTPTLALVLRQGIDALEALGEELEADDPVLHFDAVQAIGLATAALEGSHRRLLRAGLAQPRPANLLGA